MNPTVSIIGGGAWGTALGMVAARAGRTVTLWARDPSIIAEINEGKSSRHLPGIQVEGITATADLPSAAAADVVVLAVPAQTMRAVTGFVAEYVANGTPMISAAKGLERHTDKRMSEIIAEVAPHTVPAVISGPSFAGDVGHGLPTAVTIAAADETVALDLCRVFGSPTFRPYAETDLIGVEIGGAVKNVLAIAAGIVSGKHLGASALAALVARGFAELRRLGEAMGARPETLMGLSGLGDLVLTCSGPQSRNFSYGAFIGGGGDPSAPHRLIEGIATAAVARELARRHAILMPIVEAVAAILDRSLSVADAIDGLMTRPFRREAD